MKKKLTHKQKKQLQALLARSEQAFSLGRMDVLEKLCLQIDNLCRHHPDALHYRGIIALQAGDAEVATSCFRQALAGAPKQPVFHANMGAALLMQGRAEAALDAYRQAVALDKRLLVAQLGYANCLLQSGRAAQAAVWLEQLPTRHLDDDRICLLAFRLCYEASQWDHACDYLKRILKINPSHADAHYGLALLAVAAGYFDEAMEEVGITLANNPGHVDAYKVLVDIYNFSDMHDAYLTAMQELYQQQDLPSKDKATLSFALGKAMHNLAQYERAFEFYREGNMLRRSMMPYNHRQALAGMYAAAGAIPPAESAGSSENNLPIFIVGMPRCGSTLVEQILAAHPDVESRGECGLFPLAIQAMGASDELHADLSIYNSDQWRQLGDHYLEQLNNRHRARHLTDKTLSNFFWLGAIYAALPHARVVHVRRNPMDSCVSIYRHDLQGSDFQFGFDLQELGEYYLAYLQLMQHWRSILPGRFLYELDYETLVADPEGETRRLLQACELEWDESCLRFERVNNRVLTASVTQVRHGINADSVSAWKRYEKHFQTLLDMFVEIEAYSTDGKHATVLK